LNFVDYFTIFTISLKREFLSSRKSLVANRNIKSGDVFTSENVVIKRPGSGISPLK
jgi:sialic acid synthase SpsE